MTTVAARSASLGSRERPTPPRLAPAISAFALLSAITPPDLSAPILGSGALLLLLNHYRTVEDDAFDPDPGLAGRQEE